jgi:hypothetical protein
MTFNLLVSDHIYGLFRPVFLTFLPEDRPESGWRRIDSTTLLLTNQSQTCCRKEIKKSEEVLLTLTEQDALRKNCHLQFPNPLHALAIIADKEMSLLLLYNGLILSTNYFILSAIPPSL